MKIVFVDVGGTKTQLTVKEFGRTLLTKKSPTRLTQLPALIRAWTRRIPKPFALVVGMRGVWTRQERTNWAAKFKTITPIIRVLSDIELAFELTFGIQPGVLLNAGTGSIAYGRTSHGKHARAGGFGPLFGDEGSAFWIGKEIIRSRGKILEIRKLAKDPNNVTKIAGIGFKAVAEPWKKSNRAIIHAAQIQLINLTQELLTRLNWKGPVELGLWGGLFQNSRFKREFLRTARKRGMRFTVITPESHRA